jgi:hypothetical protein
MKKLTILFFLLISGCATTGNINNPPHSYSQSGKKLYTVHCGQGAAAILFGTNRIDYSGCYNLAGGLCKTRGFNILSKGHNGYSEGIMQFECR